MTSFDDVIGHVQVCRVVRMHIPRPVISGYLNQITYLEFDDWN